MSNGIPASQNGVSPAVSASLSAALAFPRVVWERWKKIARAAGIVQTRLLMVIFYFVFVFPLGLVMRLRGDPLHLTPPKGTNWTPHQHEDVTVETARRQF